LQARILEAVRAAQVRHASAALAEVARVASDDTIFAIDVHAEETLLRACEAWGKDECIRLFAEGLPADGVVFGRGAPRWRVLVDPIDGTRPLMHDKRAAWSLAAVAPERGDGTRLSHIVAAAMTQLPPTWQDRATQLWASKGEGVRGRVLDRAGATHEIAVRSSPATTLRYGFAASCNFFTGARERIARIEDAIFTAHLGVAEPWQAELYVDLYMSSGAQVAELALGRDRFVLDVRPFVHRLLGQTRTLCSHPYDLCTALIAQEAGAVVTGIDGGPLDAPMTTQGELGWIGYANPALAAALQPIVQQVLREQERLPARGDDDSPTAGPPPCC
jgi:fructose-1,6-bisphosphatase/inositol monophosphatase family enzyme